VGVGKGRVRGRVEEEESRRAESRIFWTGDFLREWGRAVDHDRLSCEYGMYGGISQEYPKLLSGQDEIDLSHLMPLLALYGLS
jgi:hypothetical protein